MKKNNTRMLLMALLASFVMVSTYAGATGGHTPNPIISSVQVKHLMDQDNKTFFQVELKNKQGEKFSVTITDKFGTELFSETSREKDFEKKFQCENLEELGPLNIKIKSLKDGQEQVFQLNTSVRFVHHVTVQKL